MDPKVVFSVRELGGGETGIRDNENEIVVNGFCVKTNPRFGETIERILARLPAELQQVFPSNVRKKLEEMGLKEKDYNIEADLKIGTITYWKTKGGVEITEEIFLWELDQIMRNNPQFLILHDENGDVLYRCWFIDKNQIQIKTEKQLVKVLKEWAGDNKSIIVINKKKFEFLVIKDMDERFKEMEKYVRISSLNIRVIIVRKGVGRDVVGDAVCDFTVFISPEGEIEKTMRGTYGAEDGKWEIMTQEGIKGHLSLDEAIQNLNEAAEKIARVEGSVIEGFKFLFT